MIHAMQTRSPRWEACGKNQWRNVACGPRAIDLLEPPLGRGGGWGKFFSSLYISHGMSVARLDLKSGAAQAEKFGAGQLETPGAAR